MNTPLPIHIQQDESGALILSNAQATVHLVQHYYPVCQLSDTEMSVDRNPYQGLAAFQEADYANFFGREQLIQKLLKKLAIISQPPTENQRITRLLPIIGSAGSGKTSLIRAGLLPALVQYPLARLHSAHALLFNPSSQPLYNLALMLARLVTHETYPAAKTNEFLELLQDSNGLREIIAQLPYHNRTLLLVIDSLDDLYQSQTPAHHIQLFLDNLLKVITDANLQVYALVTVRPEQLVATQSHALFNRALTQHATLMPALSLAELHRVITLPAQRAEHPLNHQVVNRLLDELPKTQQSLSLLQFGLAHVWRGMQQSVKAEQSLAQLNGLQGAIPQTAHNIYCSLSQAEQQLLRQLLLQLLQPKSEPYGIALKFKTLANLLETDETTLLPLISAFAQPKIGFLTLLQAEDDYIVRLTSPLLAAQWETLQNWLAKRQQALTLQQQFCQAASYWQQKRRPERLLWQSPQLDWVAHWYQYSQQGMSAIQRQFFQTSQRRQWQVRWLKRMAVMGLVVLTVTSWLSVYWANQAVTQSRHAHSGTSHAYQHSIQVLSEKQLMLSEIQQQQQVLQIELMQTRQALQQALEREDAALQVMDAAVAELLDNKAVLDEQQQELQQLQARVRYYRLAEAVPTVKTANLPVVSHRVHTGNSDVDATPTVTVSTAKQDSLF